MGLNFSARRFPKLSRWVGPVAGQAQIDKAEGRFILKIEASNVTEQFDGPRFLLELKRNALL